MNTLEEISKHLDETAELYAGYSFQESIREMDRGFRRSKLSVDDAILLLRQSEEQLGRFNFRTPKALIAMHKEWLMDAVIRSAEEQLANAAKESRK